MILSEFALRLLASIGAGAMIGLEREFNNKSAGFRTNTLVAMGACIYVLINVRLADHDGADPTRIIGQIVTGIGFLGAGVILHHGGSIHGLTTAATIWVSAALGSLAGLGLFMEVLICTVAVLIINTTFKTDKFLKKWESKKRKRPSNPKEDI
jgi:putative Mg2+ transporter-C (MgtC) family protein